MTQPEQEYLCTESQLQQITRGYSGLDLIVQEIRGRKVTPNAIAELEQMLPEEERKLNEAHEKHDGQWHGSNPTDKPYYRVQMLKDCITRLHGGEQR